MSVSADERKRMTAIASSLAAIERDEAPSDDATLAAITAANEDRQRAGRPAVHLTEDERPEEGFYRRARTLGLVPRRR